MTELFRGAIHIRKDGDWYIPERFTGKQLESYAVAEGLRIRSVAPAGCSLSFYSEATKLELSYKIGGRARSWAAFDLVEDGMLKDTVEVSEEEGKVSFALSGNKDVRTEIYLPHLVELAIKDIEADDVLISAEAYEEMAGEFAKKKLWLCLGDSITQGMDAVSPSLTYPVISAAMLGYDVINQGVGGAMFRSEHLDYIGREPDMITVAFGCNDWGGVRDADELRQNIRAYLEKLLSLYSCRNIYGIVPIWRRDADDRIRSNMTFKELREFITEEYAKYPFIQMIDGYKLMPAIKRLYGDAGELKAHPSETGFMYMSIKLSEYLK